MILTPQEEEFVRYWAENREKEKKSFAQFAKGLSTGLNIGIGIVAVVVVGWYTRANMEANSSSSPFVFLFAIAAMTVFMAFFYRSYQWEKREQQYLELLAKKRKTENNGQVQRTTP